MGTYTEINVCFDLLEDTPKEVVDILHSLIDGTDKPSVLPSHEFFKCDRWDIIARCGSYYFGGLTNSKMEYNDVLNSWKVNIRASLINSDSEIENFLDWLAPYIATYGFIGYKRYEEYDDPTLVYIECGKVVFKGVEQQKN